MKKNSKTVLIKLLISALFACLIGIVIIWISSPLHLKQEIGAIDMVYTGYQVQGDTITVIGDDPHVEAPNLQCYVNTVLIYLKEPAKNNIPVSVFYSKSGYEYTESNQKKAWIHKGDKVISVPLHKEIGQIRFDFDGEKNVTSFKLDHIEFKDNVTDAFHGIYGERWKIITLALFFILLFPMFGIKQTREFVFSHRWKIAILLLFFMVVNKYNASSIAGYTTWIQPSQGSEFCNPVFGQPRAIRTDEWQVDSGRILSAQYSDYGKVNSIAMAKNNPNISASYLQRGYSAIATPEKWLYYLIKNPEYGFSFQWCFTFFVSFMCSWELFLILTNRNRLVSLAGTFMIVFSSFFQWWSWPSIIPWSSAFLVAVYYYFKTKKSSYRFFFGIVAAISGARFVIILYPAFQVPMGYVILIAMIWIFLQNKEKWKEFKNVDYLILAFSILFSCSLIAAYLYDMKDYIKLIGQTVYPGHRFSSQGGGESVLALYLQDIKYPYMGVIQATEYSSFMSFYPLPIIGSVIYLLKSKKKDFLFLALTIYAGFLSIYVFFGLPKIVAKITLISYSPSQRSAEILGYVCIILLLLLMSKPQEEKLKKSIGLIAAVCSIGFAVYEIKKGFAYYNSDLYLCVIALLYIIVSFALVSKIPKKLYVFAVYIVIIISVVRGATVMPLMKGLDAIYSKPIAKEIQTIAKKDPDAIWIAIDESPDYLIANGAKTLNSTNFVPNKEFWEKFKGTKGVTEKNYNRYAHIGISFTKHPSKLMLKDIDSLKFLLNYDDIQKTNVKYVETSRILKNEGNVIFKKIYDNEAIFIYEIKYKNQ